MNFFNEGINIRIKLITCASCEDDIIYITIVDFLKNIEYLSESNLNKT